MDVVFFSFVEEDSKFLFSKKPCNSPCGCNIAGCKRCKGCGINIVGISCRGYKLAVFIHKEDNVCICLLVKSLEFPVNLLELIIMHYKVRTGHPLSPLNRHPAALKNAGIFI